MDVKVQIQRADESGMNNISIIFMELSYFKDVQMREKIIALACTIVLLLTIAYIRWRFYPQPSPRVHYYFISFFLSSAILIFIWGTSIIFSFFNKNKMESSLRNGTDIKNRRNDFRIPYSLGAGPSLQVEKHNNDSSKRYLFDIIDLSEKAIQISHNGLLKIQDTVTGYIIFAHGDRAFVSGKVQRIAGDSAGLQFDIPLSSELLINEQRRMLAQK